MCGFMWSLIRQHVRSGEVAQGEKDMEDTSLEEALRDWKPPEGASTSTSRQTCSPKTLIGLTALRVAKAWGTWAKVWRRQLGLVQKLGVFPLAMAPLAKQIRDEMRTPFKNCSFPNLSTVRYKWKTRPGKYAPRPKKHRSYNLWMSICPLNVCLIILLMCF